MEQRKLGQQGLVVSSLGLGCMGMSVAYGKADETEAIATLHEALDLGVNFFDTAEIYGPYENEKLLGKAFKGKREQVVIATKFGFNIVDGKIVGANSRPEQIRAVAEASLQRLGTDHLDLFYQHRVDPNVPIEDVVGVLSELVQAGKVRYIGLSEAGAETIRHAHAVHPLSALQYEYSLWERETEGDIIPVARELGIGFVPYSPLGRGFLTGQVTSINDLEEGDWRRSFYPRIAAEYAAHNLQMVESVKELAARKGVKPSQIALAWVMAQGHDFVAIPGTKRRSYLRENVAAVDLALTTEELTWLAERFPIGAAVGTRYTPGALQMVER